MKRAGGASTRRQILGQALAAGVASLVAERVPRAKDAKPNGKGGPKTGAKESPSSATHPSLLLPALPYPENALEPVISAGLLAVHYGHHHRAYCEKTTALVDGTSLAGHPLEEVVRSAAADPKDRRLFNNAAQAWNHAFYWQSMRPKGGGVPSGDLAARINKSFGSYDAFKAQFVQTAVDHFSNGWVWLVLDGGALKIVDTHDADTVLIRDQKPLAVADLWEHAYDLDYKNQRKDYVTSFVDRLLNWEFVAKNLG
jgi:Fe-Mn family superoxide dismutase